MAQGYHFTPDFWFLYSAPIFVLIRIVYIVILKIRGKKINLKREILWALFSIYICAYVGRTLFPINIYWIKQPGHIEPILNLIPLEPYYADFINNVPYKLILINIFGNIMLTIPFGVFLPILFVKFAKIKNVIIIGLLLSILIESLQFLEGIVLPSLQVRSSDINDVILNTLGVIVGYFIYTNLFRNMKASNSILK